MMNIKIQCGCGTKYALEITPADARSGVRLVCQACGVDNSAAVNHIVQQQFADAGVLETTPSGEALPVARLATPAMTEQLSVAVATVPASSPEPATPGECLRHPGYTHAS